MSVIDHNSLLNTPSFARNEVYDFAVSNESFEIYEELSQIAEEIEQCRSENS